VKIYVYPADKTGCGYYRMIWPARVLAAQGHTVEVVLPKGRSGNVGLDGMVDENGRLVSVTVPPDADVMVFQRITMDQLSQAIPLIRELGVAVVVDMDDDLTCIDPRNIAWTAMHPKMGTAGHTWDNATRACIAATVVTVSTPALLRTYAPHGRGVVLENCVPASYLDVEHHNSAVVGWPGSVHSHPGDLPMLGSSISRLVGEGHRFAAVGEGIGVRDALGLGVEPAATGVVPIERWPQAVATLGVGVAPLKDTKFNAAKSWLKPLEMAACGVPWVASPRAEYQRLHKRGCGLLADKPSRWYRLLRDLAADPGRRADMSAAGRAVAAELTIEGNAWRWLEVWEHAAAVERQATSVSSRV
jgi:hypothetical protein